MMLHRGRMTEILAALLFLVGAIAFAQDDIGRQRACAECGMDRKAYGYSRMVILFREAGEVGTCSVHCTAVALDKAAGKPVQSIRVADRDTRELVEADRATWVVGGNKRGVMSDVPKWAFGTRAAAEAFVKAHGGRIASWDEALEAARKEAR
jgi:nitrous oxide reductase accessory protein NosL